MFHILNDRRQQPVAADPAGASPAAAPAASAWSLANLVAGVKDVGAWLPLAGRALLLDRTAYQRVVADERMTGPALLLGLLLLFTLLSGLQHYGLLLSTVLVVASGAGWFVYVLGMHVAGCIIADKGSYTRTLRGLGFANVIYLIRLIGLVPALAPPVGLVGAWLALIAVWMGAAAAHRAKGWRSLILPLLGALSAILAPVLLQMMVSGAVFSIRSLLSQIGSFTW